MRAGCARAVITPPLGASLAGFGARKEGANGVHDDLYVRALVLEEAGARIALVVLDLCEVDGAFVGDLRHRALKASGIPPDRVMVAAIHTHAAPATIPLFSDPPDPAWLFNVAEEAAWTVAQASRTLLPARLSLGLGHDATVGRNRRRPGGPTDPTVSVLRAEREGAPAAMLVHYACHPTVLGPDNLLISRDYPGFTVDAVERATGGWAVFANGACGDVNVGHSADRSALGLPIPGRTFDRAEALGMRIAVEAIRAMGSPRPTGNLRSGHLGARQRTLSVPLRHTPSPEEALESVRAQRDHLGMLEAEGATEEALTAARLELMYAELALNWTEQRGTASEEPVEVQAFAIRDVALVALPGEFFAESGLMLRERSPFSHTIVVGYTNGAVGYVPPMAAFEEGGYETRLAPWSRLAPEAESMITNRACQLLEDLWETPGA